MSKQEIENELEGKGEYVQIDYLTQLLKQDIPIYTKKFVYLKLAEIYEKKGMFSNAAKMFNNLALISIAFSEKIRHYTKEAELYIKAGFFDKVEEAMKKAMSEANSVEKQDVYSSVKMAYKEQAEIYEGEMKKNHALKIYEKLLEMNVTDLERKEIKRKLLELYEKLGRFNEYSILKKGFDD